MTNHNNTSNSHHISPLTTRRNLLKTKVARIPRSHLMGMGTFIGNLLYRIAPTQRYIVRRNLQFSQVLSSPELIQAMSKQVFQHIGITLVEFLQMGCLTRQELIAKVRIENEDTLNQALAKHKGVVIVTAHLGNYEMAAQVFPCLLEVQMASVAKKMRNIYLNQLIHNLRTRFGNKIIYKKGALPEMMQTLRQGGMVTILMDISRRFEGVEVRFFNRRATATPAAALLGLRCKSPIIPGFCHRNPQGELIVQIEPPVEMQRTSDLRLDLQINTQRITDCAELAIRKHLGQWNWMLKRWKDFYPDLYPETEKRLRRIKRKERRGKKPVGPSR